MAPALARVRLLMLISAVTTAIAIAAVLGVIGYRVFASSGSGASTITNGTVFLPQGAHVVSTTIGGGRIVVTLDVNGVNEVRIFDLKTLQQTGTLHFATER
jgi:TRAP-type C4-dicarboxylate transport system permease small subunit